LPAARHGHVHHLGGARHRRGQLPADLDLELARAHAQGGRAAERGARRVIVAAPAKDPAVLNVVMGVKHNRYPVEAHDADLSEGDRVASRTPCGD
jgi:hypothetical protein